MNYHYVCEDCLQQHSDKPIGELSVDEYQALCTRMAFPVKHGIKEKPEIACPACKSTKTKKLLGLDTTYVRGYGFSDKDGAKNDMDLHLMVSGNDPYKEHRKDGDKQDVIHKLQKKQEFDRDSKSINMGN